MTLCALPPIATDPPPKGSASAAPKPAAETLAELAQRDIREIWNAQLALARYGESETIRFEAGRLLLAYAVGPPPTPSKAAAETPATVATLAQKPLSLADHTPAELEAIRVLQLGQRRRALGNG